MWREIGYLIRHAEAGRLRYDVSGAGGVPMGSGAIESTIRRVINLRLKGNSMYWTEDECGGGVPTAGGGRLGSVGGDPGADAGSDGEGPADRLALDPPECLAELKALDEEDDESAQPSRKKQSQSTAA